MWTFQRVNAARYALVFIKDEDAIYSGRVERAPGYESTKLRDILEAAWYLNGRPNSSLPERTRKLLDTFRF